MELLSSTLHKVVLTLRLWIKPKRVTTTQMKAIARYVHVVLLTMPYKLIVDQTLVCVKATERKF